MKIHKIAYIYIFIHYNLKYIYIYKYVYNTFNVRYIGSSCCLYTVLPVGGVCRRYNADKVITAVILRGNRVM